MRGKWKWILFVCALVMIFSSGCFAVEEINSTEEPPVFHWIREESRLIDFTISGDTIQFRYAFCFENNSTDNTILSQLNASFKRSELWGWLKYEKFYDGVLENGESTVMIGAGEKVEVIYVFTGEYLGGSVRENLSVRNIAMLQDWE